MFKKFRSARVIFTLVTLFAYIRLGEAASPRVSIAPEAVSLNSQRIKAAFVAPEYFVFKRGARLSAYRVSLGENVYYFVAKEWPL